MGRRDPENGRRRFRRRAIFWVAGTFILPPLLASLIVGALL